MSGPRRRQWNDAAEVDPAPTVKIDRMVESGTSLADAIAALKRIRVRCRTCGWRGTGRRFGVCCKCGATLEASKTRADSQAAKAKRDLAALAGGARL